MESGGETYQDRLSVREVKGRFERSQETRRNDVFVDEVGETHHAVFPSCRFDQKTELKERETLKEKRCNK